MFSDDYLKFRTKFLIKISQLDLTEKQLEDTIECLDITAKQFTFSASNAVQKLSYDPSKGEIPEIVNLYLTGKRLEGYSKLTLKNRFYALRMFFLFIKKEPTQVNIDDIREFINYLATERKNSNRTINTTKITIQAFFSWLVKEELLKVNPVEKLGAIKYEVKMIEPLTLEEMKMVKSKAKCLRDAAILEFLFSTGCRVSELINLKKSDVNFEENHVLLFGKGAKERYSFLTKSCVKILKEYLNSRTDNNPTLFVSLRQPYSPITTRTIERMLQNIAEENPGIVGNKRLSPHTIRHTSATVMLENGMPIEDISKILGHENIETTMIYAKNSNAKIEKSFKKYFDE